MKGCFAGRRRTLAMLSSGAATLACNPLHALMSGLVEGIIQKAQAEALSGEAPPPRNYVYLHIGGGANRYFWDSPLAPYAGMSFSRQANISSGFAPNGRGGLQLAYPMVSIT